MGNSSRPITRPAPPHGFRLLAIDKSGAHVLVDYKAKEAIRARREAGSDEFDAVALFDTQGEVIHGRMREDKLDLFREMFELDKLPVRL